MKENITGRETEIERLEAYAKSPRSEFVAIYGRRRVGKTFLIKELFEHQFAFRITGAENSSTAQQLANFSYTLSELTATGEYFGTWAEAFRGLEKYLQTLSEGPKIIFFDELPWLDTPRSDFLAELERFWNAWAFYRNDIKFIACGSATTWMLDKVINSRGGLHDRVTHEILLSPFTLAETEDYFRQQGFAYGRQEMLESYMAVGGVAYYLSLFEPDKSVAQNIDKLCFTRGGELGDEFNRLYRGLFKKADTYIDIVTALARKNQGMTRQELLSATKQVNNGNFTTKLTELESCDFIRSYQPFGKTKKDMMYQLVDPFTLFYFRFMQGRGSVLPGLWVKMQSTAEYKSWCGYAFEIVCLLHIPQIVRALGIDGSINTPCAWSYRPPRTMTNEADEDLSHGTQIDLLIDRSDNVINVCEMKYTLGFYEITKQYNAHVEQRLRIFRKVTATRKSLVPVFITAEGLLPNMYSRRIPRQVTADDLFES